MIYACRVVSLLKQSFVMKLPTLLPALTALFFTIGAQAGNPQAEHKTANEIAEILRKAMIARAPLPLLNEAKDALDAYKATGPMARQVTARASHQENEKTLERHDQVIKEVTAGRNAKSRIESSIAGVHTLAAMKRQLSAFGAASVPHPALALSSDVPGHGFAPVAASGAEFRVDLRR